MKLRTVSAAAILAAMTALPAAAQSDMDLHPVAESFIKKQENKDFFILGGAAGLYGPVYEGSDEYELRAFPFALITYKDRFYADPIRGAGAYLLEKGAFRAGAGVNYAFGRDEEDADILTGMGDIDGGAAAEISLEYRPWEMDLPIGPSFTTRIKHQFTGTDTGTQVELNGGFGFPVAGRMIVRPSLRAEYGTEEYNQAFHGVTPAQSARTGLPVYDANAGFRTVGAGVFGTYLVTDTWMLTGVVTYDRLIGDAADSPLTQDKNQARVILGVVRAF